MKRWLILLSFIGCMFAQNTPTIGVLPDSGPAIPATCVIGQLYFKTTATTGLSQCTAANTWTVVPTSSGSGTVTNTGGALTANAIVLGAGGNDTKVAAGITTDGTSKINLASGGIFSINSDTGLSRSAAGQYAIGNGTPGSTSGFLLGTGFNFSNADFAFNRANTLGLNSSQMICWTNGSGVASGWDSCLSRSAAGTIQFGTTTSNSSGTSKAAAYTTDTNCAAVGTAANPSVAACGSAASGSFSCATNASTGTCVVNTTAVTANSQIFIQEDDSLGTRLSVTCNTTNISPTSAPVAARSAGTSFTINLGTITTNPECFSYFIVN